MFSWIKKKVQQVQQSAKESQEQAAIYEEKLFEVVKSPHEEVRKRFYDLANEGKYFNVSYLPYQEEIVDRFPASAKDLFRDASRIEIISESIIVNRSEIKELREMKMELDAPPGVFFICYDIDGERVFIWSDRDGVYVNYDDIVDRSYLEQGPLYPTIYHWLIAKTIE